MCQKFLWQNTLPLIDKCLQRLRIKATNLNIIRKIYSKLIANIEISEAISNSTKTMEHSVNSFISDHYSTCKSSSISKTEGYHGKENGEEERQSLYTHSIYTQKLLERWPRMYLVLAAELGKVWVNQVVLVMNSNWNLAL